MSTYEKTPEGEIVEVKTVQEPVDVAGLQARIKFLVGEQQDLQARIDDKQVEIDGIQATIDGVAKVFPEVLQPVEVAPAPVEEVIK